MSDERGQAVPLLLVAVLLAALCLGGLARLGGAAADRASAQAAADAAALAGAADGEVAAEQLAQANRAELVGYVAEGDDVIVTVERDGARATARARWASAPIP